MNKLLNKQGQEFAVQVISEKKGKFLIPIVDVRTQRERAERYLRDANHQKGSRYIKKSYSLIGRAYN